MVVMYVCMDVVYIQVHNTLVNSNSLAKPLAQVSNRIRWNVVKFLFQTIRKHVEMKFNTFVVIRAGFNFSLFFVFFGRVTNMLRYEWTAKSPPPSPNTFAFLKSGFSHRNSNKSNNSTSLSQSIYVNHSTVRF